tara:strand:+ start:1302 stop:2633 length:1332 start_codon:yes stop_codon:yes gene_type:complete
MKKREFLKKSAALASLAVFPSPLWSIKNSNIRLAQIGVGGMGAQDLNSISSHSSVSVVALCDVDLSALNEAKKIHPNAKAYSDYRIMLKEMKDEIDAVQVSTPDHTHAPASIMAMNLNKHVYCQKPLTHNPSESRLMMKIAKEKKLTTQMGIQVHSFYDYKLATILIKGGIIGKIKTVRAWTHGNSGYDGPIPMGNDPIPESLNWNLWLGTSPERPYKKGYYHPSEWRKIVDYGCGTLGDMGVHIFDTPYNALELDSPITVKNECRKHNGFSFPEANTVTYTFPGTRYTTNKLTWVWTDGQFPLIEDDLKLPNQDELPVQGSMFIGEKGRLLLPHFMQEPRLIVNGDYKEIDISKYPKALELKSPARDYDIDTKIHYHEFIDACLGKADCSAPFSYSGRLTEVILLGVIAGRFPNKKLHWDIEKGRFKESTANKFLDSEYRIF